MQDNAAITAAGIIGAGLLIQTICFFLIPSRTAPVLPAFACAAAVLMQAGRSAESISGEDYIKTGIAGLAAGVLLIPFTVTPVAAATGIFACPAGALAALAVFLEMTKKGENFSYMFPAFSGSMVAGMFIITAGCAGAVPPGPAPVLGELISILVISLLAGFICQGMMIVIEKDNPGD
jgi:hypothetical protein